MSRYALTANQHVIVDVAVSRLFQRIATAPVTLQAMQPPVAHEQASSLSTPS